MVTLSDWQETPSFPVRGAGKDRRAGVRTPRVLHVVEALGGGVASAVEDYLRSTPDAEHHVLAVRRPGHDTGDGIAELAASVGSLPSGHLARVASVGAAVRRLRPDLVHAHSSFAGVYVRASPAVRRDACVYTPHCYAFERTDVSRRARRWFRLVEAALAWRTGCVVAVSGREAALASGLPRSRAVVHVPNVARADEVVARRRPPAPGAELQVVGVGRISPQKDPAFFAAAARAARGGSVRTTWRWVGGGDPDAEALLRASGVEVTGWVPRAEVLAWLAKADVYAHTASYEGAPVSVLEAAAYGLPVVARRIPALASMGMTGLVASPEDLAAAVEGVADERTWLGLVAQSQAMTIRHSPGEQRAALERVYRPASDVPAVATWAPRPSFAGAPRPRTRSGLGGPVAARQDVFSMLGVGADALDEATP